MTVGGWNSFEALELYLNAPTAEVVNEVFENAEMGTGMVIFVESLKFDCYLFQTS